MQSLLAAYRQETGDLSAPLAIGGGTYAKAMENIIAFGPVFPPARNPGSIRRTNISPWTT